MSDPTPKQINTEHLYPHPDNPRVSLREDVVQAIAANLSNGFDPAHALIVRPIEGGYQIVGGHHRHAAAKRAGLEQVPCWVREMSDEEAYMALVTGNAQGELSPLEIGLHALRCVGLSEGGRGKAGGIREYAERIGRDESFIRQVRKAAEVAENCGVNSALSARTQHLSAIHSLPEAVWPEAVEALLANGWSAKETAERVKASKADTDKRTAALFTGKTTQRELDRIDDLRDRVAAALSYDDLRETWLSWLDTEDPIDIKAVQDKRIALETQDYERRTEEHEEERPRLPQVVLADPPWRYDFAQSDSRQIENQYPSATVDEIINDRPETEPDCVLFLWATAPKLREALEVMDGWGFEYVSHAVWDKESIGMGYWFRGQHELLLVGKKGRAVPPDTEHRTGSVFREKRTAHSKKPLCVYEWIEAAFGAAVKKEMYCREARAGWLTHGNEAQAA